MGALGTGLVLAVGSLLLLVVLARIIRRAGSTGLLGKESIASFLAIVYVLIVIVTLSLLTKGLLAMIDQPLVAFGIATVVYTAIALVLVRLFGPKGQAA
jgi:hypothetical protein